MGMGPNPFLSSKERKEKEKEEDLKVEEKLNSGRERFNEMMANRSQNPALGQTQSGMSGFDKFQAMQAARDNTSYQQQNPFSSGFLSGIDMSSDPLQDKMQAHAARQRSEQGARFNAAMGANPLILQQLQQQMGQRQMGPQFNAFGFGAQPGLSAQGGQGGQGGSMLANISSQGMNQLAAGQQNNPTIFKAKS